MYGDPVYCRQCGQMITFIKSTRGKNVPVDSFSLNVVPKEGGAAFFTEDGRRIAGVAVDTPGPNTVKAWRWHGLSCPKGAYAQKRAAQREETWGEMQARKVRERLEKEQAEAAAKEARRQERKEREEKQREFEEAQLRFSDYQQ